MNFNLDKEATFVLADLLVAHLTERSEGNFSDKVNGFFLIYVVVGGEKREFVVGSRSFVRFTKQHKKFTTTKNRNER